MHGRRSTGRLSRAGACVAALAYGVLLLLPFLTWWGHETFHAFTRLGPREHVHVHAPLADSAPGRYTHDGTAHDHLEQVPLASHQHPGAPGHHGPFGHSRDHSHMPLVDLLLQVTEENGPTPSEEAALPPFLKLSDACPPSLAASAEAPALTPGRAGTPHALPASLLTSPPTPPPRDVTSSHMA